MDTFGLGSPNYFVVNLSSLVCQLKRSFFQRANRVVALNVSHLDRMLLDQSHMTSLYTITYDKSTVGRALPEAIEIALRGLFRENQSHTAATCKNIYIHNQSSCCLLIALLSYTDIL